MKEMQELIDAEEVSDSDYDSYEGSVIINFQHQHMKIQHQHLQLRCKNENNEYDERREQEERCVISRRMSMAATTASRSEKYSDTDILINTESAYSVFRNENMLVNIHHAGGDKW